MNAAPRSQWPVSHAHEGGDRLLDAGEVAELLGVSTRWVRDHTRSGLLPHVPLGRYVRYDRGDVLAWVASVKRPGQAADWQRIRPRRYPKAVPNGR